MHWKARSGQVHVKNNNERGQGYTGKRRKKKRQKEHRESLRRGVVGLLFADNLNRSRTKFAHFFENIPKPIEWLVIEAPWTKAKRPWKYVSCRAFKSI
jgi:hypothetical protein